MQQLTTDNGQRTKNKGPTTNDTLPIAQPNNKLIRTGPTKLPGRGGFTPIVLAHGVAGHGNLGVGPLRHGYFYGIERALANAGHPTLVTAVAPLGPVAARAERLASQVRDFAAETGEKPLIVGHSMGGLDARYALSKLNLAEHAAGLVTVATPHHGSPAADWIDKRLRLGPIDPIAGIKRLLGFDLTACGDLTTNCAATFNRETPDASGFPYFSITTGRPRPEIFLGLRFTHDLIEPHEGLNDGLVSRISGRWGEELAHWPVDHTHSRNQRLTTGLPEVTPRYLKLLDDLHKRGILRRPN